MQFEFRQNSFRLDWNILFDISMRTFNGLKFEITDGYVTSFNG